MALPIRSLGRTGLSVSILGFGAAPLGDLYARLDEATAVSTVASALQAGITLIDTSPLYGHGLSELRVGAALRRVPGAPVAISTKVGRVMDPFKPSTSGSGYVGGTAHAARFDYSYDGTMRSLEQSLLRLGVGHIDIALIHDVDVWTHGRDAIEGRFREAMEGAYRALDDLRRAGTVRAIGVGVNEADMCERFARSGDVDAVLLAGRYSLLEQPAAESFLPLAKSKGIGVMLGGVFNSGILATGAIEGARYNYRPAPPDVAAKVSAIDSVCRRHGVRLYEAALQFSIAHPAVSTVVLGAVAPNEVHEQIEAIGKPIPPDLWTDLRKGGFIPDEIPTPG
ncbi:MAG: aldo/keto reductase [Alphaproteobacteria bacterium]|nr:aldo/keto reductase [Alphaproteobacteria bacterium]